jgi:hypothetical protein
VHDQTGNHDVEVVASEGQRFGGTHLELAIRNRCSLAPGVLDHRLGRVSPNYNSVRTNAPRDEAREVAGPAAYVEHPVPWANASGDHKRLIASAPSAEKEKLGREVIRPWRCRHVTLARSRVALPVDQRVHQARTRSRRCVARQLRE